MAAPPELALSHPDLAAGHGAAEPLEGHYPHRLVGKIGIDATAKAHRGGAIFERAWPRGWGKVKLEDFLD